MELYQLRTFAMVAEAQNLTRAAKRLHASQPAVSAHIKALEDELGVCLFLRTPKGMVLTADGQRLREHADTVLASAAAMEQAALLMRGVLRGDLRIGINSESDTLRVAELFAAMTAQHPDLHLHLLQAMTGEVANRLDKGELDAGFMFGEHDNDKLFFLELAQMELVVVGSAERHAELEGKSAKELGGYPWIFTPNDCPLQVVGAAFFARHGLVPQQAALIDDESIIRVMVKNGIGLSLLLRQDALRVAGEGKLAIWEQERLLLPLSIVCLRRRKDEPLLQALFSILSRIWHSENNANGDPGHCRSGKGTLAG